MKVKEFRVVLADYDGQLLEETARELNGLEDIRVAGQTRMAEEILPLLRETGAQALVMELILLGGDGLEVLGRIREEFGSELRIIVTSHYADRTNITAALRGGADYFMIKPVAICALAEQIRLQDMELEGVEEQAGLEYRAAMLLRQMGGMPNAKGFCYLLEALAQGVMEPASVYSITKLTYPAIARRHRTTAQAVERAIRNTISAIWAQRENKTLSRLYQEYPLGKKPPTNGAFIAVAAQQLGSRWRRWG